MINKYKKSVNDLGKALTAEKAKQKGQDAKRKKLSPPALDVHGDKRAKVISGTYNWCAILSEAELWLQLLSSMDWP